MRLFKLPSNSNRTMPGVTYRTGETRKDTPDWILQRTFNSNYYSGLDMSCYFSNIYMDEIIQLTFQEAEQTRPNMGYADYTYRSVTHGARIVQGSFTINFKEAYYIPKLLDYLASPETIDKKLEALTKEAKEETDASVLEMKRLALKGDFSMEDFVNSSTKNREEGGLWSELMDALDSAFWGEDTELSNAYKIKSGASQARSASFKTRPKFYTTEDGFEIVVKYGQPEENVDNDSYAQGSRFPRWGTLETLQNCHITSVAKSIDDSGKNILEVYSFIASTVA